MKIGDPMLCGAHYAAVTMRTAPRDYVPDKKQLDPNWQIQCQQQAAPIWNLVTPSGLNFSLVSSSLQGAIRQGRVLESIQWALELLRTDADLVTQPGVVRRVGKGETNLWTRFYVICAEDIALANPVMIVIASLHMMNKVTYATYDDAERGAISMVLYLTRSMKSRAVDWACICRVRVPEPFTESDVIPTYFNRLMECMIKGDHVMAVGYAESFIEASLMYKGAKGPDGKSINQLPKNVFGMYAKGVTIKGAQVKHYTNLRQLTWVAMLKVLQYFNSGVDGRRYPNVTQIVEACYEVAHNDRFRWEIPGRLFERMAILTICMKTFVEDRGLDFKATPIEEMPNARDFTPEEIDQLRYAHRNGNLWYGISDVCKDKHSKFGKELGRDVQHFIEVKSFLRHEDPALMELSDFYLKLCFQTRYYQQEYTKGNSGRRDGTFDKSGMTTQQYAEWIPTLRLRNTQLNAIEDAYMTKTIMVTFTPTHTLDMKVDSLKEMHEKWSKWGARSEFHMLKNDESDGAGVLIVRNAGAFLATYAPSGPNNASMPYGIEYALYEFSNMASQALDGINDKNMPAIFAIRDNIPKLLGHDFTNLNVLGQTYPKPKEGPHQVEIDLNKPVGLAMGASISSIFSKTDLRLDHGDLYVLSNA